MHLTIIVRIRDGILYKIIINILEDFITIIKIFENKISYKEVDCY